MFLGTYNPRLDDKGRLALPAKFRPDLEGGLVITKGPEHCILGFSVTEFTKLSDELERRRSADGSPQANTRVFFASASQEVPDAQGRITVAPALRSYAGLSKECAVIGHNNRFEIWDAAAWQSYLEAAEEPFATGREAPAWL